MDGRLIVGSRESRLAVVQSMTVVEHIKHVRPDWRVELLTMKTTGDRVLDRTLDKVGGKGLFVRELDEALRLGRVDVTVHSLKDMPMQVPEALPLMGFSRREDPRDALVLRAGVGALEPGMIIGSSSNRRAIQLKRLFPACEVRPVRGNVQTRLRKLDEGRFDALVLAAAGLKRLRLEHRISRCFSVDEMIPAAGQGILAVQGRRGEDFSWLAGYADEGARCEATAERAFVKALNGGCDSPVCAHARCDDGRLTLMGLYWDEGSGRCERGSLEGRADEAEAMGIELARRLSGRA